MEDVLDLYEEKYDEACPVICFDEKSFQMLGDVRETIPACRGQAKRIDYEYKREGTCNLFVFFEPLRGWRQVKVTDRRTKQDFAACMKDLVDEYFPKAQCIRLVMDNLNTHSMGSLYETYPPEEARRIIRKLEVHYTPKHGSWLNMAEIEISSLARECLRRRIPSQELLQKELQACVKNRNGKKTMVAWGFFFNGNCCLNVIFFLFQQSDLFSYRGKKQNLQNKLQTLLKALQKALVGEVLDYIEKAILLLLYLKHSIQSLNEEKP